MKRKTIIRLFALILLFAALAMVAVSSGFALAQADHHCTGEDCSVCRHAAIWQNLLKSLPKEMLLLWLGLVSCCFFAGYPAVSFANMSARTPVGLKVKLSN